MTTPAATLLCHAADLVDGARNRQHGDKERSFAAIADFWNVYLKHQPAKYIRRSNGHGSPLDAADVAAMMVLMKLARSLYGEPIPDHFIDMAGYAAILGELEIDPDTFNLLFGEPPNAKAANHRPDEPNGPRVFDPAHERPHG